MADADREIAKRMLQYRQLFDSEIKKAAELEAQAQAIKARISVQQARVDQGLPTPDACPDCWVHYPEQSFIWRTGALRRICRGIVGPGSRHKIRAIGGMRAGSVLASKVLDEQVRFRRASRTSAGRRASSSSWL
jgi:hypothetical protein